MKGKDKKCFQCGKELKRKSKGESIKYFNERKMFCSIECAGRFRSKVYQKIREDYHK